MLLGQIRDYVKARGVVTLQDIMLHFDIAADTAEFALNYWIRKAKIQIQAAACGSCTSNSCGTTKTTQYLWVQRTIPLRFHPRVH